MNKSHPFFIPVFSLLLMVCQNSHAQYPGGGGGGGGMNASGGRGSGQTAGQGAGQGAKLTIGHIFGKVVDSKKRPIEFASVAIYMLRSDSLIGGQLTETNGDFSLDNLPFGGFKLKITSMGYVTQEQKVIVTPKNSEQDLGNLVLADNPKTLNDVTITAERSTIELKPDKKVFNVEKDLSTRGGTGEDVMKNIPGVSTDASGNVTLRNLTPIIYVDGKPTTLTMDQIPADQIEKVEVITNPSAKYEADATGGIINVVLKKNHQPGYNGQIVAAVGTNDQYNGSALINVREKKFGFMLNYNVHGSTSITPASTDRTDLNEGVVTGYLHQSDQVNLHRVFQTARVGFDGYIDNHNTLSLTQSGTFGNFNTGDNATILTDSADNALSHMQNITENQNTTFRNFTTNLDFTHTYTKPDKQWTLFFSYNHVHANTNYLNTYATYTPQGSLVPYDTIFNPQAQSQDGYSYANQLTAQWDFEDPINSDMKLEFGARSNYQRQYSYLTVTNIDSSIDAVSPSLSGTFRTDNLINAAYITFSHTIKGFSYQLGMRFEETYFNGIEYNVNLIKGQDSTFSYKYPSNNPSLDNILDCFFPSFMLSQKFGDKHELQFNVTRKINRPGFRQIAPFIYNSTPSGYSQGNPGLQPEFDNKAELNYDLTIPVFTWLSSAYGSYNQQPITQYTTVSTVDSEQIVSSYINAKNSFVYGWENTFKIAPAKGLDITADANVFYTYIQSQIGNEDVDNQGISYVVKGIISYKLPLSFVAQVNGTYEAPKVIPQGHTLPLYFFDVSLSKDFNFVTLTLAVSDVMNTKAYGTYYDTPDYTETTIHRRDPRYARLGATFKFGKMDSSLFKKMKQQKKENANPTDQDLGF
jgi:iron complex outermembrane recepter protein